MKNYYKILGVLQEAEDIVIKAAYKALIQRYHPDRWKGDPQEAHDRVAEINEAYAVLSDTVKRKEYDKNFSKSDNRGEYEEELNDEYQNQSQSSSINKDWDLAITVFPDLENISNKLKKVSNFLFEMYRDVMLDQKQFKSRTTIADVMLNHFLSLYFGKNEKIQKFALKLIHDGDKKHALFLNKLINVIGDSSPDDIIFRVEEEIKHWRQANLKKNRFYTENIKSLSQGAFLVTYIGNNYKDKLKVNDVIYELNNQDVRGKSDLFKNLINQIKINNDTFSFSIVRGSDLLKLNIPSNHLDFKFVQLAY